MITSSPDFGKRDSAHSSLAWLSRGAPLLPRSLRTLWSDEALPPWLCAELGLPLDARIDAIGLGVAPAVGASERLQNYLALLLHSRLPMVGSIPILNRVLPVHLSIDQIPWRRRTHNCLQKTKFVERLVELPRVLFSDLFAIPGMGAVSVLDFACTLEAVLDSLAEASATSGVDQSIITSQVLTGALGEQWADWVSENDVRFADLLPVGKGTLIQRIDAVTSNPEASAIEFDALAIAVSRIRTRIDQLDSLFLEDELQEYVSKLFRLQDKRINGIMARLNLDGSPSNKTQDEAGVIAGGITRQRIQQLEVKGMERRPAHPIVMPKLDRAITLLIDRAPLGVEAASNLLVKAGITRAPFHPASVIAASAFCGRSPSLEIQKAPDREFVAALSPDSILVPRVVHAARGQAGHAGATNVSQVAETLAQKNMSLPETRVAEIIRLYSGAEFLTSDWFWFPSFPNDVVRNLSRKMLSVSNSLSVAKLRDGIKRQFRFRESSGRPSFSSGVVPPREILAMYYRAHPDFVVTGDSNVRFVVPLDFRLELTGVEGVMASILQAAPSRVLDRVSLTQACVERGINISTLWTLATYSPVMEHLGTGMWTLRGTQVDPAFVESFRKLNALRPRERRTVDFGWTKDGELWMAVRLPVHWVLWTFPIPADIGRFVERKEFSVVDASRNVQGLIKVQDGSRINGLQHVLRRLGADDDDIVLIVMNLATDQAIVSIVDEETLDELNPQL